MAARGEPEALEQEDVPAVAASATPLAIPSSLGALPAADQLRPNLSPALVMRLQGSAGNAAVSALIDDDRRGGPLRRGRTTPTAADAALMARLAGGREPGSAQEHGPATATAEAAGATAAKPETAPAEPTTSAAGSVVADFAALAEPATSAASAAPAGAVSASVAAPTSTSDVTAAPTIASSEPAVAGMASSTGLDAAGPSLAAAAPGSAAVGSGLAAAAAAGSGAAGPSSAAAAVAGAVTGLDAAGPSPAAPAAAVTGAAGPSPAAAVTETAAPSLLKPAAGAAAGPADAGVVASAADVVAGQAPAAAAVALATPVHAALADAMPTAVAVPAADAEPAAASGDVGALDAPQAAGDAPEADADAQGPAEDELALLQQEMEHAQAEQHESAEGEPEDDGPVLARAAVADPPASTEEADDEASVSADAQSELAEIGAPGGDATAAAGGGGGGGGAAVEAKPEPAAPSVANADPAVAVSAAAGLKPAQMLATLDGADQAAANAADAEHKALQADPPTAAAAGKAGPGADEKYPDTAPAERPKTPRVAERTGGEPPAPTPVAPAPPKAPLPPAPAVSGDEKGNVSQGDAARIQASIASLPTIDGGAVVPTSEAPKVTLQGAADPSQMAEQEGHLSATVAQATALGRAEANEPAGENELAPTEAPETIKAEIPASPHAAAAQPGGATDDQAASIVADEKDGQSLKAAVAAASAEVVEAKRRHAQTAAQQRAAAAEEVKAHEAKSQADQLAEHAAARAGVSKARSDWTGEQKAAADKATTEARAAVGEAHEHIASETAKADAESAKHIAAGTREAADAKRKGEQDARAEREKAQKESSGGGFFGWVKSKATALFDSVKASLTSIFDKVRQAITAAIDKARDLATSAIKSAVKFVADKVKAVADRLVALGDALIPGFQALRQKFKAWIVARVRQATAALNAIVNTVKKAVKATLQAVGSALTAAVDLLKQGMQAAIKAVKSVVKGAIDAAKAVISALGTFAALVKDVAANPGQWIANLGAAIVDGIKNHLWVALKSAIQQWFNDKVESLLGLGQAVWGLLTKGGIAMAQVGQMVWEGVQAALPTALITILVERLASMIVPAAGAVMAIVQGLVAAWGAVQRILAAIERFVAFLKAVKLGNAGPQFAQALAAAAVAVIEFISQFLLRKIAGAVSKIAGKIKAIAQRIGRRLLNAVKKVGGKLKSRFKRSRLGQALEKRKHRRDEKKHKKDEDEDDKAAKQKRLDTAVTALKPKVAALIASGTTGVALKARLLAWKLRYRLSKLEAKRSGERIEVVATVNPFAPVGEGTVLDGERLREIAHLVAEKVMQRDDVIAAAEAMRTHQTAHPGEVTPIMPREGMLGTILNWQGRETPPWGQKDRYSLGEFHVSQHQRSGETNAYIPKVGTYPEIADGMRATGLSDRRMAVALLQMTREGKLSHGLSPEHADLVASTAFLMFGRESHRAQSNVVLAPVLLDLIAGGHMTFEEAFSGHQADGDDPRIGGRGAYPQSMIHASAAERGLALEEGRPVRGTTTGTAAERAELKRREIALITRWVETKYKAELGAIAVDESTVAARIEKLVLVFYGLR